MNAQDTTLASLTVFLGGESAQLLMVIRDEVLAYSLHSTCRWTLHKLRDRTPAGGCCWCRVSRHTNCCMYGGHPPGTTRRRSDGANNSSCKAATPSKTPSLDTYGMPTQYQKVTSLRHCWRYACQLASRCTVSSSKHLPTVSSHHRWT